MKETVTLHTFREAFRAIRRDNFSHAGLAVLFEHLESLEDDLGEEIELDPIAICCDYAESTASEIASDFNLDIAGLPEEDTQEKVLEYLEQEGALVGETTEGTIVYRFI